MRRILYITLLVLILPISNINAQQNVNLNPYVGTWKYTNASTKEEFTVVLRETTYRYQNEPLEQCIVGIYIYKKNGQIIYDNSSQFTSNVSAIKMPIYAGTSVKSGTPSKLIFYVKDYGKMKNGSPKTSEGWLTLISSSNPKQLRWQPEEPEGVYVAEQAPIPGFSIPTDIILTKVE